jgi:hypothetical protein
MSDCDAECRLIDSMASSFPNEHRRLDGATPSVVKSLVLYDINGTKLWPPEERPFNLGAAYAAMMTPEPRPTPHAYTADWWKDAEIKTEMVRAEQARMAGSLPTHDRTAGGSAEPRERRSTQSFET